jgi:hypothetical protein
MRSAQSVPEFWGLLCEVEDFSGGFFRWIFKTHRFGMLPRYLALGDRNNSDPGVVTFASLLANFVLGHWVPTTLYGPQLGRVGTSQSSSSDTLRGQLAKLHSGMSRCSSPAAGAPTVFFMDLDAGVREAALPSPRVDDVAGFLQGDMGHSGLEASTWILSRQPTTLTVALYYGRVENELNWRVSLMLRRQVLGRAAVVCVEEGRVLRHRPRDDAAQARGTQPVSPRVHRQRRARSHLRPDA